MNNMILDVNENKKKYPVGTVIRILVYDGPISVSPGTLGTVVKLTSHGSIIVRLENKIRLELYPGRDRFDCRR